MNLNPDFIIESFEQNHDVRIYYNYDPIVFAWRFCMKREDHGRYQAEQTMITGGLADSQWNSASGPRYLLNVLEKMYLELVEKEGTNGDNSEA